MKAIIEEVNFKNRFIETRKMVKKFECIDLHSALVEAKNIVGVDFKRSKFWKQTHIATINDEKAFYLTIQ